MTAALSSTNASGVPPSEAARNLLTQKLHAVQHRKVTPPSLAKTTAQDAKPAAQSSATSSSSSSSMSSSSTPQQVSSLLDKAPKTFNEANAPPPPSINSGTPLPALDLLPPPSVLSKDQLNKTRFVFAQKKIVSPASLRVWETSKAFDEVLGFVMTLNDAVVGRKLTDNVHQSDTTRAIVRILDNVECVIDQVPPEEEGSSRFGNAAFRTFYAKVKEQSRPWHQSIPGLGTLKGDESSDKATNQTDAIGEIETYFIECFGNEKRIDYGSGMELNFLCWLMCLVKLGVLDVEQEAAAIVLRIFWRYVEVMRRIQSTYWLEPAGSHGVWGLDDYHFLPFLFGSAQLKSHKIFRPKSIHDDEILADFGKQYMYFACIRFINSIKTASLRWHSPMLDDISGVKTWAKVNEGMMKMYKAEVLLKLPIAQHIFFGSLLAFPAQQQLEGESQDEAALRKAVEEGGVVHTDEHGHTHVHTAATNDGTSAGAAQSASGWGDCCGIPIPSAFAAAQQQRQKMHGAGGLRFDGDGVRRIPFD